MTNPHAHHSKKCLDLQWGKARGTVKTKGAYHSLYVADVELWFCNDCQTHFIIDWHARKVTDLRPEDVEAE